MHLLHGDISFLRRREAFAPILGVANRHHLDEAHVPFIFYRQTGERGQLVSIESAHDHGIQLDGREMRTFCGCDPLPDAVDPPATRDSPEFVSIQCIQADIQTRQACLRQRRGETFQQHGIGRQADFFDAVDGSDAAHDLDDLWMHQWLAARKTNPLHTTARGRFHHPGNFIHRQLVSTRLPW